MSTEEVRKWIDGGWKTLPSDANLISECREKAEKLLKHTRIAVFVSLDENGHPEAKAMLIAKGSGLNCIRFSTNASSKHVEHIRNNPTAVVYVYDASTFEGVMLAGTAREEPDQVWRVNIWEDGYEKSYSGIDDPDYFILRFDAAWGNYYHEEINVSFTIG